MDMTLKPYKILVIDDLADWRSTLYGLLSDAVYRTETAEAFPTAIAWLESRQFDLAIVDVRLDESDEDNTAGLDLAGMIRKRWPLTKVVIITGHGMLEHVKRAMASDVRGHRLADDYILKHQTVDLIQAIQRVLEQ